MDRQKEYVLRTVEERGVRFVRLWFTDVLGQLKFCRDIGVDRVTCSLPAEVEDRILPILDRWAELQRQLA